jgi:hypothetical protein
VPDASRLCCRGAERRRADCTECDGQGGNRAVRVKCDLSGDACNGDIHFLPGGVTLVRRPCAVWLRRDVDRDKDLTDGESGPARSSEKARYRDLALAGRTVDPRDRACDEKRGCGVRRRGRVTYIAPDRAPVLDLERPDK